MNCTKAIIPVAGYGTRRLPITKAIEKCMLPILNRPMIDYVVQDCIQAGITDIYIVVSPRSEQVKRYYSRDIDLEEQLRLQGKEVLVPQIQPPTAVQFHFVEQTSADKQGTAVPVWLCRDYIEDDEQVLILMGDDVIYNADGSSEVARLIDHMDQTGVDGALLGVEVPHEQVSHYGVLATESAHGFEKFAYIQEKPAMHEAKSNLINISKYIVGKDFFAYLDAYVAQEQAGEYYITDPLNKYVAEGKVMAVLPAKGEYLDSGTVENWLKANEVVAKHEWGASSVIPVVR